MRQFQITYKNPAELQPRKSNPRTHSDAQIKQLKQSISHFGFTNPVLVDAHGGLIAGHGRLAAALQLGLKEIPTVCLDDMSEQDIRAYVIADNKLALNAGWDEGLLALEFDYLSKLDIEFDLSLTGFELPEIDIALQSLVLVGEDAEEDPADLLPETVEGPTVTRLGDIWHIGPHRLICGDSTANESYQMLLGDSRAQMIFSDPPYNVPISGHVSGLGQAKHREFEMASGEMSPEQFTQFLTDVFHQLAEFSVEGSIHYQCMDWRHMTEILQAGGLAYTELKNLCVWSKTNGGMGSLYRSQHELVFVFKSGRAPHINNVELGKHGRYRTNVWTYAGANSFGEGQSDLNLHPTVKPVAMVRDAILDCSDRGNIVLDPFSGSGSTLIAAHQTGRHGYGVEIDPQYCDVIIRRLTENDDLTATLGENGPDFDAVAAQRRELRSAPVLEEEGV